MKKIALAATALFALSGAALAEAPNGGGPDINTIAQQQQQSQVDATYTSSIGQGSSVYSQRNPDNTIAAQNRIESRNGQRDFGNR